ncbi:hypothetical protein NP233_g2847 [Leucocoprinus birnbaumii]|uniref:Uncharacterized protein n=1 Tax=Leucocoprinus birnbaumii TaxID=56174 RepID=A0AAD5YTB9_9AGAR|nr:hypothetical protein NP233_g2847 [Leucocoprinus birnbaumii]
MTSTIMEPYDAPMVDYQTDHDVQMHLSSSDPWFQDVAPMEDDQAFQQKGTMPDSLPTVEVDMEVYAEDEHIEYEMVDDQHGHHLASGELLDVDVLDASTVPSPLVTPPVPHTPPAGYSQPQPPVHHSSTPEAPFADLAPPPVPVGPVAEEHSDSAATAPSETIPAAPVALPESLTLQEESASEHLHTDSHSNDDFQHEFLTPHADATEASTSFPLELTTQLEAHTPPEPSALLLNQVQNGLHTSNQDLYQIALAPDASSTLVNHPEALTGPSDSSEYHTHDGEAVEGTSSTPQQLRDTNRANTLSPEASAPTAALAERTHKSPDEVTEQNDVHQESSSTPQPEIGETQTLTEVLDEVPEELTLAVPPPILLSIFSTDQPELCLFNKPSEPLANQDESQECHILFQQVASLYYEPLANVFEALRQDEYVSTVLEVSGNELGLEAYDLDLAITEDNYYGREISLHDIYTLHTSANLAGPLRLRLYISGTRFIVRYHMLQEGLIDLHVDESQVSDHDETDVFQADDTEPQEGIHGDEQATDEGRAEAGASETVLETSGDHENSNEEEEDSQADEDHEAIHGGAAEEVVEETGEIDLSTLPDFVDSPEATEEVEYEDAESSTDPHLEATGTGGLVIPSALITDSGDDKTNTASGVLDGTDGSTEASIAKKDASPGKDIHEGDYSGVVESNVAAEETPESQSYQAHDETGISKHLDDRTERTPQPEDGESANKELTDATEDEPIESTGQDKQEADKNFVTGAHGTAESDAHTHVLEELEDFDADTWDDELDGEGDPDTTWEVEKDNGDESKSNESSITLSSKASKRSFDDFGLEHSDDDSFLSGSPGLKRARVE